MRKVEHKSCANLDEVISAVKSFIEADPLNITINGYYRYRGIHDLEERPVDGYHVNAEYYIEDTPEQEEDRRKERDKLREALINRTITKVFLWCGLDSTNPDLHFSDGTYVSFISLGGMGWTFGEE